jgi:hypothetical protein
LVRLSEWLVSVYGRPETVKFDTCAKSGIDVFCSIFYDLAIGVFGFSGGGVDVLENWTVIWTVIWTDIYVCTEAYTQITIFGPA